MNRILVIVLIVGSLAIAAVVGFLTLAPPLYRHLVIFRDLDAEAVEGYSVWNSKRLTILEEMLKAPRFAPATKVAADAFYKVWEKDIDRAVKVERQYYSKAVAGDADFASVNRDLETLTPLLESFERLVSQPDYEIFAQTAGLIWGGRSPDSEGIPCPDFLAVQKCVQLLCLKALSQANAGQLAQAFDTVAVAVRSGRGSPCDLLVSQLVGVAVYSIGARAWGSMVTSCNDPQLLRRTLVKQNDLARGLTYLTAGLPLRILDSLSNIREISRRGVTVNVQGLTARQIEGAARAVEATFYTTIVLPRLGKDPNLAAKIDKEIKLSRDLSQMFCGEVGPGWHDDAWSKWIYPNFVIPILYAKTLPNSRESLMRAEVSRVRFDLLRIETARRIWTLEHGKPPVRCADLVPSLLPELPSDRLAKQKLPYGEEPVVRSVGPDGIDQSGTVIYDPTNGTYSMGDLVLAR